MIPDKHQQQFGGTETEIRSFRGIRSWEVTRAGAYWADDDCTVCQLFWNKYLLVGVSGYHWIPDENLAECRYGCSLATPDCSCGFYAYWQMDEWLTWRAGHRITGVIDGYGNITLGTKGFRCSKARILAMVIPENHKTRGLEQIYQEVRVYKDIPSMLTEFPPSTVGDAR
jgi:hypothetical protein